MPDGKIVATGICKGSLYYLSLVNQAIYVSTVKKEDSWHRRYGHLLEQGLRKLAKESLVQLTPRYRANLVNKKPRETGFRDNGTEELMGIILFVTQYSQVGKKKLK